MRNLGQAFPFVCESIGLHIAVQDLDLEEALKVFDLNWACFAVGFPGPTKEAARVMPPAFSIWQRERKRSSEKPEPSKSASYMTHK
jgi:hypothetical protein